MRIPAELLPQSSQIPFWIDNEADRERFELCFAIGRRFTRRDDPVLVRALFATDLPTGDPASLPEPDRPDQLGFDLESVHEVPAHSG
jgi:hypothetical protein